MASLKFLTRRPAFRAAACWLGAQYIRFVWLTGRWRIEGAEHPEKLIEEGRPFIIAFWHGRLLMLPTAWRYPTRLQMVISQHADGELISRTIGLLGIGTLAGSTSRGAAAVLRGMIRTLLDGGCVGITPDGPRGPRMRASDGIVAVARLSGVPVIPATYSINRGRNLRSWDRFLVAWPFGRGVIVWGEPIHVAKDADAAALERARLEVETALNAITIEADALTHRPAVEPAEAEGAAA